MERLLGQCHLTISEGLLSSLLMVFVGRTVGNQALKKGWLAHDEYIIL